MAGARTPGKVDPALEAALAAADPALETADNRPDIVKLFDKIGLKIGSRWGAVYTTDGSLVRNVIVAQINGIASGDNVDAVLTLQGDGTRDIDLVVWSKVARLTK